MMLAGTAGPEPGRVTKWRTVLMNREVTSGPRAALWRPWESIGQHFSPFPPPTIHLLVFVGLSRALQDASHNLPTKMSPDVIRCFPWEQNHPCQDVAGHVSESSHLRGKGLSIIVLGLLLRRFKAHTPGLS